MYRSVTSQGRVLLLILIGATLNAYNDIAGTFGDSSKSPPGLIPTECVLVVDSGYSHTAVVPLYQGKIIQQAIRRLDIGGKFITNYLKEIISVRQLNVLTETHIINQLKESVCFVSTDFKADMEKAQDYTSRSSIVTDYVMPDFTNRMTGLVKEHNPLDRKQMATFNSVRREDGTSEAILTLSNERFTPPELLFNPTNVGMRQAGISETIMESLSRIPTGLWPAMLSNIYLVGGNTKLPGFKERL
jgi:actin-related protein 6